MINLLLQNICQMLAIRFNHGILITKTDNFIIDKCGITTFDFSNF
jgi:hypothetical protein